MSIFNKTTQTVTDFVKAADDLIDKNVTSQEERGILKNGFTQILTNFQQFMEDQVTQKHISDNKDGNWLTRSVRPIISLLLVSACIIFIFLGKKGEEVQKMFQFTEYVVLAYFGLREVGKTIIPSIGEYTKKLRRKG